LLATNCWLTALAGWLAGWVLAGLPINRPLFFDFPADPNVWEIDDVYMFGPTMLAAPVTDMGARTYSTVQYSTVQYSTVQYSTRLLHLDSTIAYLAG